MRTSQSAIDMLRLKAKKKNKSCDAYEQCDQGDARVNSNHFDLHHVPNPDTNDTNSERMANDPAHVQEATSLPDAQPAASPPSHPAGRADSPMADM